jgi:hypothetical protein
MVLCNFGPFNVSIVSLTLTLSPFDYKLYELEAIPYMVLEAELPDYWLLLPFFEKLEEATGKLIDLGESCVFDTEELGMMAEMIAKEVAILERDGEESLFVERDDERTKVLLEKLKAMVTIGLRHNLSLLAISQSLE